MLLRTRILRDLMAGQSTVSSMALRLKSHDVAVQREIEQLVPDGLITAHTVGDAFLVFRLTPNGRDEATRIKR